MAPKPKKEMTDAQKEKLKKMVQKGSKFNFDKPKPKKASTSYSPRAYVTGLREEMYAVQGAESKKKSDARIAAKKAAPRKPKAGSSTVSKVGKALAKTPAGKVVKRAKTVAREVRDIPTAVGTVIRSTADGKKGYNKEYAAAQLKKQLKEVKTAAKSGAKGKSAVQYGGPRGNR